MKKIIAVVNDNTGEIYAISKEYTCSFPHKAWLKADNIYEISRLNNHEVTVAIQFGNMELVVNSNNYSFIYKKEQ